MSKEMQWQRCCSDVNAPVDAGSPVHVPLTCLLLLLVLLLLLLLQVGHP
jgi:hypothetical protein